MPEKITLKNIEKNFKQEDAAIILQEPITIMKYGKAFTFKPILWKNWERFDLYMGCFIQYYHNICGFSSLPDRLNEIQEFNANIKTTLTSSKVALKYFMKMLNFGYWDKRFIRNKFTLDDMAEFFIYAYILNIRGVKKNFKIAYELMTKG
jgi:hypothetical protein